MEHVDVPQLHLVPDVINHCEDLIENQTVRSINANNTGNRFLCLQCLVSVVKFIAERGLGFRDDENVGSPRNFFQNNVQKFFQTTFKKKWMLCLWCPVLQQFHKSLITVKYHVAT